MNMTEQNDILIKIHKLLNHIVAQIEKNPSINSKDFHEYFGEKENIIGAMGKIISLYAKLIEMDKQALGTNVVETTRDNNSNPIDWEIISEYLNKHKDNQ